MSSKRVTAPELSDMKARGEKISVVTAYDYPWAQIADEAGVDVILVGDSLGMVVLGYEDTLSVTMADMVRHTAAVSKAVNRAFVIADMPFLSYQISEEDAIKNAGMLIQHGNANSVKLEGGAHVAHTVKRIVDIGIPVVGHIGMTPQSVNQFGGFKKQGKDEANAARIKNEALALQDAGACAIVLEVIPSELAAEVTASLQIPTIGIGAGPDCDGQVMVMHDLLGIYKNAPKHAKQYCNLHDIALKAYAAYSDDVKKNTLF